VRAGPERLGDAELVVVRREDQELDLGEARVKRPHELDAVAVGHVQVDQEHVRRCEGRSFEGLGRRVRLPDHDDVGGVGQGPGESLTHDRVIVDEIDADLPVGAVLHGDSSSPVNGA
jgi:hypothetical protein